MWSGSGKHHTTKDRERSFRGGETAAAAEAAVEAAVALEEASAVSSRAASFSRAGSFSHGTDRRPTSPRSSAGTPRLAASPRAFSSGSDSSPRAAAAAATPRASALRAAREPTAKELKAQAKDLRGKAEELEQRAQLVAEREASMERALAAERARLEAAGREPQEPWVAFAQVRCRVALLPQLSRPCFPVLAADLGQGADRVHAAAAAGRRHAHARVRSFLCALCHA